MALKSLCFIKANPGTGDVLGQVIAFKNTGSTWSAKETDQEDANTAGLRLNVVDLDLTQEQIDNLKLNVENPDKYKVNDVDNPTSLSVI
jgi:hypothetical protein